MDDFNSKKINQIDDNEKNLNKKTWRFIGTLALAFGLALLTAVVINL